VQLQIAAAFGRTVALILYVAGFSPGWAKNQQHKKRKYLAAAGENPHVVATE
jgi:hypothetical protein